MNVKTIFITGISSPGRAHPLLRSSRATVGALTKPILMVPEVCCLRPRQHHQGEPSRARSA
jgi:hypothetical protein